MIRTPLFTFKHYIEIIQVMRAIRPELYFRAMWLETVYALADLFERDNPKFKRGLFIAQCKGDQND